MTTQTYECLKRVIDRHNLRFMSVLDVGGRNVNGGVEELWLDANCTYEVADIELGEGVDYVVDNSSVWDLGQQWDVVTSIATLEHVKRPWILAQTLGRHVKPGGYLYIDAPFAWPFHRYPVDCWRVAPDGMAVLFEESGVELVECALEFEQRQDWTAAHNVWGWFRYALPALLGGRQTNAQMCWGIGQKTA